MGWTLEQVLQVIGWAGDGFAVMAFLAFLLAMISDPWDGEKLINSALAFGLLTAITLAIPYLAPYVAS